MEKYNPKNIEKKSFYQRHPVLAKAGVTLTAVATLAGSGYNNAFAETKIDAGYDALRRGVLEDTRPVSRDLYAERKSDSNLSKISATSSGLKPFVEVNGGSASAGLKYTSNNFSEFFWGISRPFHLYNTNPETGEKEILPFYNLRELVREGALFGFVNPRAWKRNPSLTAGTTALEIMAGVAIALSGGGGSDGPPEVVSTDSGSDTDSDGDTDEEEEDDGPGGGGP